MTARTPEHRRPRQPLARIISPGVLILTAALLAAACGGSSDNQAAPPPLSGEPIPESTTEPAFFVDDPVLANLVSAEVLALPNRFQRTSRTDREPILSLGLVQTAARITYTTTTTNEILAFDLLRLEPDVDAQAFFDAFVNVVGDDPRFRSVTTIGVLRGLGERARHYAFRLEDADGEIAAILRSGVVVLVSYRRPPLLRQPVDPQALLTRIDTALQAG